MTVRGDRTEIEAIKASVSLLDLARRYGVALKKRGREWWAVSPFRAERTPSFHIYRGGEAFKCFATGESGDVFRFVQLMEGVDFKEALDRLRRDAGAADPETLARRAADRRRLVEEMERCAAAERARNIERALGIWRAARAAEGTVVQTYLGEARAIDLGALKAVYGWLIPPSIRFHPELRYRQDDVEHCGPAMVGALQCGGRFCGVHRTWLKSDGSGKADLPASKLTLGVVFGSGWKLSPTMADAVEGEGVETTLTVMAALASSGRAVFGVCASCLGNMAGRGEGEEPSDDRACLVLPDGVERVTVLQDNDGKTPEAREHVDMLTKRAVNRHIRRGIAATRAVPPEGKDFNDLAMDAKKERGTS